MGADVGSHYSKMICNFCLFSALVCSCKDSTKVGCDTISCHRDHREICTPVKCGKPSWLNYGTWFSPLSCQSLLTCRLISFSENNNSKSHFNVLSLDAGWEYWPNWVGVHSSRSRSSRVTHGLFLQGTVQSEIELWSATKSQIGEDAMQCRGYRVQRARPRGVSGSLLNKPHGEWCWLEGNWGYGVS